VSALSVQLINKHSPLQSIRPICVVTTQTPSAVPATADPNAWEIVKSYAKGNGMLFPKVKHRLQMYLGSQYQPNEWQATRQAIGSMIQLLRSWKKQCGHHTTYAGRTLAMHSHRPMLG
jgi:hypothetical protein